MTQTKPEFRYKLKSIIIAKGYKSAKEFSDITGIGLPKLSRIIRGWEIPSASIQKKMAQALGISLKDFQILL